MSDPVLVAWYSYITYLDLVPDMDECGFVTLVGEYPEIRVFGNTPEESLHKAQEEVTRRVWGGDGRETNLQPYTVVHYRSEWEQRCGRCLYGSGRSQFGVDHYRTYEEAIERIKALKTQDLLDKESPRTIEIYLFVGSNGDFRVGDVYLEARVRADEIRTKKEREEEERKRREREEAAKRREEAERKKLAELKAKYPEG